MNIIKKMPYPIAGLILGIAALGNLLQSYSEGLRLGLGAISAILFIMLLIKMITGFEGFKEFMSNPLNASVFATYPMALMLLAGYAKPFIGGASKILWYIGVISQIAIIIYVTVKFLTKKDISMIFASTYIPFAGMGVASITAPAFDAVAIGRIGFWFGLICYLILTPFIFKRIFSLKTIPEPAKPTNGIICAPLSLLLAGYNSSFAEDRNVALMVAMLVISQAIYFLVVSWIPKLLKTNFKPSFSGFTFPLVISAIALKTSNAFLTKAGMGVPALGILVKIEEAIALVMIVYIFILYMKAIFAKPENNI